jgi:L-aminopeptidase/D-esterase-like protein
MMFMNRLFKKTVPATGVVLLALLGLSTESKAQQSCNNVLAQGAAFANQRREVREFTFNMPGLEIASLSDSTLATGVTLFKFGRGATAVYDARGGSVAAVETTLLDPGSYSNEVDGVIFSGGSTMGLAASHGVRTRIFQERSKDAGDFDFIPSVPGAVVYDYGGRVERGQDKLIYPDHNIGAAAFDAAEPNKMLIGRAGAGTTTTANKISQPIWGGQGASFEDITLGSEHMKVFTAVVLNPHGDIHLPGGIKVNEEVLEQLRKNKVPSGPRKNTTLSIVITDVALDRNQLQRLATMVHTSMAGLIHPFHSYTDGDILFAVSLNKAELPNVDPIYFEEVLQMKSSKLMKDAILSAVTTSNAN